ncbi:MAG: phosphonoacetaldehyde reductase [Candidatus Adiutrix sp.]|jgi:alcohol dehydrogenase|nr:phosphonoacetaldehyde reductase [Candidatus Adiutrix sp.]
MSAAWFHYSPVRIHGGQGCTALLENYIGHQKALLLTSPGLLRRRTTEKLMTACPSVHWLVRTVPPYPEMEHLEHLAAELHQEEPEVLVALGGGSVIDSAKALAAALGEGPAWSLSEHLRESRACLNSVKPIYCLPTTAGSGAEATPFATIWDQAEKKKYSLEDPRLYAKAVFLEPKVTISLPPRETLWGALDTLSHGLETLWNKKATPISLALAREAIALMSDFLPRAQENPANLKVRIKMQEASLLGGLAISQSHSTLAHSIGYPLTLRFGVPHGLASAFTLPALYDLIEERGLWRYAEDGALAAKAAALVRGQNLGQLVREYCQPEDVIPLAGRMRSPGRADNFRLNVGESTVVSILQKSLK